MVACRQAWAKPVQLSVGVFLIRRLGSRLQKKFAEFYQDRLTPIDTPSSAPAAKIVGRSQSDGRQPCLVLENGAAPVPWTNNVTGPCM